MTGAVLESPVGPLTARLDDSGVLVALGFGAGGAGQATRAFDALRRELDAFFQGTLREFTIAMAPAGTSYQQRVWAELLRIPYGETISYRELARRTGSVARAVGQANGANPIAIIIPCHRVVAADGTLGGYGGGLDAKRMLLSIERSGGPGDDRLFEAGAAAAVAM